MNTQNWIDRLYADRSLIAQLHASDAEQLMRWSEAELENLQSDQEAERLFVSLRLINRYVQEGEAFEGLFAALRANSLRVDRSVIDPDEIDPEITNYYPG